MNPCTASTNYGEPCQLDLGHKGYHSTVVYVCDGCGARRRGQPYRVSEVRLSDGTVDDRFGFCFVCVKKDEEYERKSRELDFW